MPFTDCRSCNGSGTRSVARQRQVTDKDGKTRTETFYVTEDCPNCNGSGVVPK